MCQIEFRRAQRLVFVRGIVKHNPRSIFRKHSREHARVQSSDRPSRHDVRRRNSCAFQKFMKIRGNRRARPWIRPGIAPSDPSAVKPTSLREFRYLGPRGLPRQTRIVAARIEDHCRTAASGAENVHCPSANVYGTPNLWKPLAIFRPPDPFVYESAKGQYNEYRTKDFYRYFEF